MPADDGGSKILGYVVQVSMDVDNNMANANAKGETGTANDQWASQVATADDADTEDIDESRVTTAATEYTYKPEDTTANPDGPLTAGNVPVVPGFRNKRGERRLLKRPAVVRWATTAPLSLVTGTAAMMTFRTLMTSAPPGRSRV